MPDHTTPPPTSVSANADKLLKEIAVAPLSVLCGRNNSGKSYVLRKLLQQIGESAYYLGPSRYFSFNLLSPYNPTVGKRRRKRYQALIQHFNSNKNNVDNSPLDLGQAIAELSDSRRQKLFELLEKLLGYTTEVVPTVADNSMSQRYVSVEGFNLAFQSSGFRLAATLLTCLLDADSAVFIVDEPELGLSPEAQGVIADFLFDPVQRAEHFPHLQSLVLATHSPVFLNRSDVSSNYIVRREEAEIDVRRTESLPELSALQFLLLGNRLETLFLPGAIVLVEGPADEKFLARLCALRYPDAVVSVFACGGDGRMPDVVAQSRPFLGSIQRSPYHDRVFCVLDSVHEASVPDRLRRAGVRAENVRAWSVNGIEHLYPEAALASIFGSTAALAIDGDEVKSNGVVIKKVALAERVADLMSPTTVHRPELHSKLLDDLDRILAR